jgi:uncharacterized protein (TIGR03000 family)
MIDNFNFGDRAKSIIYMRARSPTLKGGTDMFRRMVTRMEILALAGLGLLLVAGPAKAQQGWPWLGSGWGYYGGSGRSSAGSYSPSSYATSPSSAGSYYPNYYATYQTWIPQPWGYYSSASPENYYRSSTTGDYYASTGTEDYYRPSTAESPGKRPVRINLRVPSDAKIWFDGSPTNQTGTTRSFESPPVAVGSAYAYQIRIQWKRDGKDVTQTRQVTVHAGDVINLTLGSPPGLAAAR